MKTSVDAVVNGRVLIDFDFHFRAMRNSFPFKVTKKHLAAGVSMSCSIAILS